MTPEQFVYWFQGFAELNDEPPTRAQWQAMRDHVATVFHKETPPVITELGLLPRRALPLDRIEERLNRTRRPDRLIC